MLVVVVATVIDEEDSDGTEDVEVESSPEFVHAAPTRATTNDRMSKRRISRRYRSEPPS